MSPPLLRCNVYLYTYIMSTYDNVYDMTVYVIYIHRCKDECMEFIVLVVIVYVDIMVNII